MDIPGDTRSAAPADRRRHRVRTTALLALAALAGLGAMSTSAMALEFTMFPARDFVEVAGLSGGDVVDVELLRAGVVVGEARNIAAFQEAVDGPFIVLVNHPGGTNKCWDGHTPDVLPGDVFRATVTSGPSAGPAEDATVANVTVTQQASSPAPGTIVVRGTAQTATGEPIPLGVLEQRMIKAPGAPAFANGTRRLSAPGDGELSYDTVDNPLGINWTANYNLIDSDVANALAAESRILHLGDPLAPARITIFETPVAPGPFDPAVCPAFRQGPTIDLTAASDTGASDTDNVTADTTPSFIGASGSGNPSPGSPVNIQIDGVTTPPASTLALNGSFLFTPSLSLVEGVHKVRASNVISGTEVFGPEITVTIDTTAPAAPSSLETTPASGANNNLPLVRGTAAPGSTVHLFAGAACTGPALVSGQSETFASTGLSVVVADNSTSTFSATAQDLAGNVSGCSAGAVTYQEVTPTPTTTTTVRQALAALMSARVKVSRLWRAPLTIACTGPSGTTCSGEVTLLAKRPPATSGKAATAQGDIVIGTKSFVIRRGIVATVKVTLNARGQALLAGKSTLRVRAKVVAAAGSGVARSSRTTLTLVAPSQAF